MTIEERRRVIESLLVIPWWNLHDAAIYLGRNRYIWRASELDSPRSADVPGGPFVGRQGVCQ
jgi:hypothetical protein